MRCTRAAWVWLTVLVLLAAGAGGVYAAAGGGAGPLAVAPAPSAAPVVRAGPVGPTGSTGPAGTPAAAPLASPVAGTPGPAVTLGAPAPAPTPVLRMPDGPSKSGRGTFSYDGTAGVVRGRAGELRRYRVAVENGADEDIAAFAAEVDAALGDPASWIGSGRLRLQRVPGGAAHDFTVYLATAPTARRMCAAGWVNIMVGGVPYTSCRAPGRVILNLDRWRLSVPHFVAAGVPLATYRTYVVNHEVGHELGYRHERCPGRGRPAPVMMQQTLFLRGCVANPWPYLSGRRHAGPQL